MRTRSRNPFTTVRTAGLLLPVDLLARLVEGDRDVPGLSPEDYHLAANERLSEAASRAWSRCLAQWQAFRTAAAKLPASDQGTTLTRERWLLILFQELGYGRLQPQKAIEIEDRSYPVSHCWSDHVPIHLVSFRYELDRRTPGAAGAATRSPYSMVQELLNRSAKHRWGFVSNGRKLYVLRDNASLARSANVAFDLESMFDGEVYSDFLLLFLVCHESRVEIPADGKPEDCWLEQWSNLADEQGTRAREKLRDGVENAIEALGAGFLTTPGNEPLRDRLRSGELSTQDYYRELLRVVYRLLLLLVAEEKKTEDGQNLLHPPSTPADIRERYARFYSIGRLRTLAAKRRGTAHVDLYESLKVLFALLREGYAPLGVPGLGSFLFSSRSTPDLDRASLSNEAMLDAVRELCITEDTSGRGGSVRRPVDFGNLGSEELGSVYESLLELHPLIETDEGPFTLSSAAGNERKTTGSYYTARSLINCLLDSALDPVIDQAVNTPDRRAAEEALLSLTVCDPACGSGHFLIAAAERMARRLASLRSGDEEPTALDVQHAKRDIIGRCVYGVDLNPMAVELCKVSLWMEALEPGKPLSFLDHHIQCGNSLLGTTPALLAKGIPEDAFTAIEADDKSVCSQLRKDNKQERKDYERGYRDFHFTYDLGNLPAEFARLTAASDDSVADVDAKASRYADLVKGMPYRNACLLADAWCATFVWTKDKSDLGRLCPTERSFRNLQASSDTALPQLRLEVAQLRDQYQWFHWHLAFPDVFHLPAPHEQPSNGQTGWSNGFDIVLGNPPWERIKLQEKEWFSERVPSVAQAPNTAARQRLIIELRATAPAIYNAFLADRRRAEGESHFVRNSERYPLCGRGDINTYTIFSELNRSLLTRGGRLGCIVPPGIATDDTTKHFFREVMESHLLVSLYAFVNEAKLFPAIDHRNKFCLLTIAGSGDNARETEFAFGLHVPDDIRQLGRCFRLSATDIDTLNPNTKTCPIFLSDLDAEITKSLYRRVPILERLEGNCSNPWSMSFFTMFHMANDSSLFHTLATFNHDDVEIAGNVVVDAGKRYLPLYEGKMIWQFDHRFGTYDGQTDAQARAGKLPEFDETQHSDPDLLPLPRYWVDSAEVDAFAEKSGNPEFLIAFREITNSILYRTAVFSLLPVVGVGHKAPLLISDVPASLQTCLLACCNAFVFDYIARQKLGGVSMSYFVLRQLPVIPPSDFTAMCPWSSDESLERWIRSRVMELTYTSSDVARFARQCGYDGPPMRWNDSRRFQIRCELDAAYFYLYLGTEREWREVASHELLTAIPVPSDAIKYILDTFPIVRSKDEVGFEGQYRTKNTILKIYDQMAEAIRTGQPYQTSLDPPPGPPSDAQGNFMPFTEWEDAIIERYRNVIHSPKTDGETDLRPRREQGEAILLLRLLLRALNATVQRDALELTLLFALNEEFCRRVLEDSPVLAGKHASKMPARWLPRMDRQLKALKLNGIVTIEDRDSRQFISLSDHNDLDSPLAQSYGNVVQQALKAFQKIKAKREGDAFTKAAVDVDLRTYLEESESEHLATF